MCFYQKNLRALCILLSATVLHACAATSRVEVPFDAAQLLKRGAGVLVYRGIEYPIMNPLVGEDTISLARVSSYMKDGTLRYLAVDETPGYDRKYRMHVDSAYELLTAQPLLRIPKRAIAKVEMDEANPAAVLGNIFFFLLGVAALFMVVILLILSA